ncbi:uncharacterized protein LOC125546505 [Triticum urartu]|uniref:uncharacterized protein LOC125546505 n=1 Tax=Triticum urartu TaxID=4572 RepID=UPI002042F3AB|nr:uncharacterized protein LOC125546505 [Triticum urartu]
MEEEEASAELISPRISFSHDLAAFAAAATTCPGTTLLEPRRSDASLMPRRRRRRAPEPEFDFANAAAADVAPGRPPSSPTQAVLPRAAAAATASPLRASRPRSLPVRSAAVVLSLAQQQRHPPGGRVGGVREVSPARFPLMRSRSTGLRGGHGRRPQRPHCKKSPRDDGRIWNAGDGHGGGGVRVSPVLNVTSIGTSVVNMLSHLLCDCGEKAGKQAEQGLRSALLGNQIVVLAVVLQVKRTR